MHLNEICKRAHENAVEKGFWGEGGEGSMLREAIAIGLIHTEVSELMEAHRAILGAERRLLAMAEELADVVVRCGDLAEHFGVDLDKEVRDKMRINTKRPAKHNKRY